VAAEQFLLVEAYAQQSMAWRGDELSGKVLHALSNDSPENDVFAGGRHIVVTLMRGDKTVLDTFASWNKRCLRKA
jgi:hypothetical protein